ncbi:MAG: hypothetical protein GC172_03625 [Phycisphaera sp.]|nr:hypothetical protein [Phycisphaera sp.]
MGTTADAIALEALFAGRRVAVAQLPPMALPTVDRGKRLIARATVALVMLAIAIGAGYGLAVLAGRWWVGLIAFLIVAWVCGFLFLGVIGAAQVSRESLRVRRERALEDPIGRLLPDRNGPARERRDPSRYAALFELAERPVLILDKAFAEFPGFAASIGALAARGRMPEPEEIDTSSVPAGTAFGGVWLIVQSFQFWVQGFAAGRGGALGSWAIFVGAASFLLGLYLVVRDPWLRRKLNLPSIHRDAVVGAGWLRDGKGNLFTVDDSILIVTFTGGALVHCVRRDLVSTFYISSIIRPKPRAGQRRGKGRVRQVFREAASGAAASVGLELGQATDAEMPGPDEPLRLLLSSWTYPEPRPDLAMRD